MALATICPHCHTTFRVASDQLKLRGGIVRCGACHEVFDGTAALVDLAAPPTETAAAAIEPVALAAEAPAAAPHVEDAPTETDAGALPVLHSVVDPEPEPEPQPEPEPETPAADSAEPIYTIDFDTTFEAHVEPRIEAQVEAVEEVEAASEVQAEEHLVALPPPNDDEPFDDAPAGVPTAPPAAPTRPHPAAVDSLAPLLTRASAAGVDRLEAPAQGPATVMPAGQSKAARRNAAAAARKKSAEVKPAVVAPPPPPDDEPEFVRSSRLREETGATRQRLMLIGAAVLALLLLAQGVWTFRNTMAARYPATRAVLGGACAVLGCKVELPAQIDALAVETGELQTLDAGSGGGTGGVTFAFTTLLRNQGDLVQAWPHLELALTDANDKTLVRRVIAPADYLPPGGAARGFAARSEQPVKLYFQLNQIKASGYHLAIFYP